MSKQKILQKKYKKQWVALCSHQCPKTCKNFMTISENFREILQNISTRISTWTFQKKLTVPKLFYKGATNTPENDTKKMSALEKPLCSHQCPKTCKNFEKILGNFKEILKKFSTRITWKSRKIIARKRSFSMRKKNTRTITKHINETK